MSLEECLSFADFVKWHRKEKLHLTQEKYAERLGKDLRTVQSWEAGEKIPHDQTIKDYICSFESEMVLNRAYALAKVSRKERINNCEENSSEKNEYSECTLAQSNVVERTNLDERSFDNRNPIKKVRVSKKSIVESLRTKNTIYLGDSEHYYKSRFSDDTFEGVSIPGYIPNIKQNYLLVGKNVSDREEFAYTELFDYEMIEISKKNYQQIQFNPFLYLIGDCDISSIYNFSSLTADCFFDAENSPYWKEFYHNVFFIIFSLVWLRYGLEKSYSSYEHKNYTLYSACEYINKWCKSEDFIEDELLWIEELCKDNSTMFQFLEQIKNTYKMIKDTYKNYKIYLLTVQDCFSNFLKSSGEFFKGDTVDLWRFGEFPGKILSINCDKNFDDILDDKVDAISFFLIFLFSHLSKEKSAVPLKIVLELNTLPGSILNRMDVFLSTCRFYNCSVDILIRNFDELRMLMPNIWRSVLSLCNIVLLRNSSQKDEDYLVERKRYEEKSCIKRAVLDAIEPSFCNRALDEAVFFVEGSRPFLEKVR